MVTPSLMRLKIRSFLRRSLSLHRKNENVQKPPYVVKPFHDPSAARASHAGHGDHNSKRKHSCSPSARSSLDPKDELVTASTSPGHIVSETDDTGGANYMPNLPAFAPLALSEDEKHISVGKEKNNLATETEELNHSGVGAMGQVESHEVQDNQPKRKPMAGNEAEENSRRQALVDSGVVGEYLKEENDGKMDHESDSTNTKQDNKEYHRADLTRIVDLNDSEDIDYITTWAPAVTHEIIKPTEHEIIEERVYREIHNHDYYHYVLPVHETEILPARHFITNPDGSLVEVSGETFPDWTAQNQQWQPTRKESEATPLIPRQTAPQIISDKTYTTPEGYPRRETTILHPPELEDLSGYTGPVIPVEFTRFGPDEISVEPVESREGRKGQLHYSFNDLGSFSLTDMMNSLPVDSSGDLRS